MPTLPWAAPKSPQPGSGPVTVMASRLELRRLRDVPSFLAAALRIRRQMLGSPGALGVSLIARPLRGTFWTLSAWQDHAALRATVGREPHLRTMRHFQPRMAASSFVTWTDQAANLPVPWDEALRRLDKPDTVHDHRAQTPGRLPPTRCSASTSSSPPISHSSTGSGRATT